MKRILLAGAAVLALTTAQPVLAADAPVYKGPPPAAAALFNWSGFYIGVNGGGGWGTYSYVFPPDVGSSLSGWAIGGTLGWNWQAPGSNIVFGIEGDLDWTDIKGNSLCPNPVFTCNAKVNWLGTVRGRIGVAANTMLFYLTGGFATGQVERESTDTGAVVTLTQRETATGWTAGGGVEVAFTNNMSGKLEYLYVDLNEKSFPGTGAFSTVNIGAKFSLVRVGLNWRF
ncbi:MAG TPA: outer membrane beta-barrel protein [Xanthobacteraceae bacterium]